MPRLFVSYKWESDQHIAWVKRLATDLRTLGIDAILDQWEIRLGDSLTTYMATKIGSADAVLFIVTPGLVASFDADQFKGGSVQFEMQMSIARRLHGDTIRLIAAYRAGTALPTALQDNLYIDFREDHRYEESLARITNDLLGKVSKPALGSTDDKTLELTRRIQDCFLSVTKIARISVTISYTDIKLREPLHQECNEEKKQFDNDTDELAYFTGMYGHLFPPEVTNISYLIWHDLMDFYNFLAVVKNSELHLAAQDFLPFLIPKIQFLQKALDARTNGRRPPAAPSQAENENLYRTWRQSASLPAGALDIDTIEKWLTTDAQSVARRESEP